MKPGCTSRGRNRGLVLSWLLPLFLLVPAGRAVETKFHFAGNVFSGWRQPVGEWRAARAVALDASEPARFTIAPGNGVAVNGARGKTAHLITEAEFSDAQIHVEFCIAKRSNSGVYVMSRYEVQIYDSFGVAQDKYPGIECGGIYPRWIDKREVGGHSPRVNASKPPGQWQTFDITIRAPRFDANGRKIENARFVRVRHNGKLVHENVEVTGPTRSALFDDEKPTGPLMLQGDHGPVAYRNLRIKPLKLK